MKLRLSVLMIAISLLSYSCRTLGKKDSKEVPSSIQKEVQVGRLLAARLAKKYRIIRDPDFTIYLNQVTSRLTAISSRQELQFVTGILDTQEVNAFACPGGYIFITLGALQKIDTEEELAGVLAHEISHITLNHSGHFEDPEPIIDIISQLLAPGGDIISSFAQNAMGMLLDELLTKGRSKAFELEADKAGVLLLAELNYGMDSYMKYLNKLKTLPENQTIVNTHPPVGERLALLERMILDQKLQLKGTPQKSNSYKTHFNQFMKGRKSN